MTPGALGGMIVSAGDGTTVSWGGGASARVAGWVTCRRTVGGAAVRVRFDAAGLRRCSIRGLRAIAQRIAARGVRGRGQPTRNE